MTKSKNARLILPATTTYQPVIHCFMSEPATNTGSPSQEIDSLMLAVEGAITNVMEYAFLSDEDVTFEIIREHTIKDIANDAAGLVDALNIDKAHISGMSMGGYIAQTFAINNLSRCGR